MRTIACLAAVVLALPAVSTGEKIPSPWSTGFGFRGVSCSAALASFDLAGTYYGIDLVPTKRVPGTGNARGIGRVTFSESPYGVSVSPEGAYVYDLELSVDRIKKPKRGVLTAWVTRSDLSEVERLGALDERFEVSGRVDWNKFLVVVTLEPSRRPTDSWQGPIVMRGMSRSGLMHTLAGHGPYEQEPCAKYGFR